MLLVTAEDLMSVFPYLFLIDRGLPQSASESKAFRDYEGCWTDGCLQIKNIRVSDAILGFGFSRHDQNVAVNVLRKEGEDVAAIV